MDLNECIEKLTKLGWVVKPVVNPELIKIRAYKPDTNEKMRVGSNGEWYSKDDDGWMYQIATIDAVKTHIIEKGLKP